MRVILNADDLGLSEAVNAAVFDAVDRGWLRSVSVMANGPAFAGAVRGLAARPGVGVGVHLNLTEFSPLTAVPTLRPLLDEGRFCARSLEIGSGQLPDVVAEWGAQIQRVVDVGFSPDHLDSHQHLHYRPALFPALVAVAGRFEIRGVRGMAAHRLDVPAWRGLPQWVKAARFAQKLRGAGFWTTDGFGSASVYRNLKESRSLRGEVWEVMVHPGNPAHAVYAEEMGWVAGGGLEPLTWADALRPP